jgi:hypothetical protein
MLFAFGGLPEEFCQNVNKDRQWDRRRALVSLKIAAIVSGTF